MDDSEKLEKPGFATRMSHRGRDGTPEYRALKAEYEALKAHPDNWSDVRRAKRTSEQQERARAWALENGQDPETV